MDKFDAVTGGLSPSDLIVIGAQPSVGKSAFSLWISKLVAEQNKRVLFISLEMSAEQIATRMLSAESGIPYTRIQDGKLEEIARDQVRNADLKLRTLPFIVDDRSGQSISDIRTKARREQVRAGLDLLVVDYLQIACADPSDVAQVSLTITGLKGIAKDLGIPVIALSQLSRNIEHRDGKEPQLSDLKQSSQIEQDADLAGFLYYKDRRSLDKLTFVVKKHRNGPLGEILYFFDKNIQRFNELDGRTDRGKTK
jgi:replicative DNA helicase